MRGITEAEAAAGGAALMRAVLALEGVAILAGALAGALPIYAAAAGAAILVALVDLRRERGGE